MSGFAFRSRRDVSRIRSSVKKSETAVRHRSAMPRKQHPASGEGDKNVVIFRCGPSGCLQYRIVNQSQVSAGNMDTLFNSLTGWNDVDDACAGGEAGDTFQANALTAAFESPDVVVLATDNNRVYQVSASDGLFYEIP